MFAVWSGCLDLNVAKNKQLERFIGSNKTTRNKQKPEVFIIALLYYLRYCTNFDVVIKIKYEAIEFLGSVAFKVLVG
jgi:hypothetical protein